MSTAPTEVMAFPKIRAIVRDNGTAEVVVAGNSRIVPDGDSLQDLRNNALALVVGEAQTLQRPVRVQIEDPEGHGELIVHPDNKIESVSYEARPARRRAEAPETTPETVAPTVIDTVPVPHPSQRPPLQTRQFRPLPRRWTTSHGRPPRRIRRPPRAGQPGTADGGRRRRTHSCAEERRRPGAA